MANKPFIYHENTSGKGLFVKIGDAWAIDEESKIFAVADSPLRCLIRDTKQYPYDDHGYEAASTFCNSFVSSIKETLTNKDFSDEDFRDSLISSNRSLKQFNEKLGKKYGDINNYDVAETVGVGAVIHNGTLFYGGLEDCYVNVLRGEELINVAPFNYQIMKASKYVDKLASQDKLKDYVPTTIKGRLQKENEWEPCWCNHLRNNMKAVDEAGNLVGWGCFTGEETAEDFFQVHSLKLEKGDKILIFSNGMITLLNNDEFKRWFCENAKSNFHSQQAVREKIMEMFADDPVVNKEKTILYFEYDE